jgi:hypothetical protein
MRLADVIKAKLCPIVPEKVEYCRCSESTPIRYGCVYGDCEIYYCSRCHRIISYVRRRCYFPYSR